MSAMSRRKGANGEREARNLLRSFGFTCERTGRNGVTSEDVTHDVPGIHLEVKRAESLLVGPWIRQAERDANGKVPVVLFRRSREPWRVVVPADEYFELKRFKRDALRETIERVDLRRAA